MIFVTSREMTASPRTTWEKLAKEGELTITKNGQPAAIMLDVDAEDYAETMRLLRQVKAARFINRAREEAAERGFLSQDEINAEIAAARREAG